MEIPNITELKTTFTNVPISFDCNIDNVDNATMIKNIYSDRLEEINKRRKTNIILFSAFGLIVSALSYFG